MARRETGVSGLSEMLETLKRLPPELGSKGGGPTRAALFAAAKVVRDEARNLAPRDTGRLADNIVAVRWRKPQEHGGSEMYKVWVRSKRSLERDDPRHAWYWWFVEAGTSKMAPRPFMRPAFDSKSGEALQVFSDTFRRRLDAAVKKARAA